MRGGSFNSRLVREGAWAFAGQAAGALAALAGVRILTELLAPEEFGRLTLLVGMVALAVGLAASPTLQAVIRLYSDAARRGDLLSLRSAARRRMGALVIAGAAGAAVVGVASVRDVAGLLVAALVLVDALRLFELAFFNAARRQRPAAMLYAADAWARPLFALFAVLLFGASAQAALSGYLAGSAVAVLALRATTFLEGVNTRADAAVSRRLGAEIARYARPLAPLALLAWVSSLADRYLVGGLIGLGPAGLFAAAAGLVGRPFLMFGTIVELTLRPVLHEALAAGEDHRAGQTRRLWLAVTALGSLAGVVLFWGLGPFIAALLLAEPYREPAILVMPWLALGCAFRNLATVHTRFCYAYGDTRAVLALQTASAAAAILALAPAIMLGGLLGAAMAMPLVAALELGLAASLARRAGRAFRLDAAAVGQPA